MKKIILLTSLILVMALALGACVTPSEEHKHTYATGWTTSPTHHWHVANCEHTTEVSGMAPHSFNSNNKCTVCNYEKEVKPQPPTPTPTPSKQAEEAIAEFVLSLGDNFTVTVNPSIYIRDMFELAQEYRILLDGNKIYATQDSEKYYAEENEGSVYVYTQDEEQAWHRKLVTDQFKYPTLTSENLTSILENVNWEEYDEENGIANGYVEFENEEYLIVFILTENGAGVEIYTVQYILGTRIPFLPIGHIEIFDIGTTAVTLPESYVEDPVTPPSPELPTEPKQDDDGTVE